MANEMTHAVRFSLADLQLIRIAVSLIIDKTPNDESTFKQGWQRLLPELDNKIEKIERYERAVRASKPRSD